MQTISKVLVTTDVPNQKTAWTKARADVSKILGRKGYSTLHLPELKDPGKVLSFLLDLRKSIPGQGHIFIEYPFDQRKRTYILSLFRLLTRTKIYALIHDLDALRDKSPVGRELAILNSFDGLISHNSKMTSWLVENGFKKPLVDLDLFDYYSDNKITYQEQHIFSPIKILIAGNLSFDKSRYIYDAEFGSLKNVSFSAYGAFFEPERLQSSTIDYKGVFDPNIPILDGKYHFGLVWDGPSMDTCAGEYGSYMKYNNPHKVSLYISLGLPVIVWEDAAIAKFILKNRIGLTIRRLKDLENLSQQVSSEYYDEMAANVRRLATKVSEGDFLSSAVNRLVDLQPVR